MTRRLAMAVLLGTTVGLAGCGAREQRTAAQKPAAARPTVTAPRYGLRATSLQGLAPLTLPVLARMSASRYDAHDVRLDRLVPAGARLSQIWFLPGRGTEQILVRWNMRAGRWGMTLWVPATSGRPDSIETRWFGTAVPVIDDRGYPTVRIADATSDGQRDAIIQQDDANHGCGPHQVLAGRPDGRAVRTFASWLCETDLDGRGGLLRIRSNEYRRGDAMCCPHGVRCIARRWTGQRYRTVVSRLQRRR